MGLTIKQQIDDVEMDFDDFLEIHHPEELIEEIFSYVTQFEHSKQKLKQWLEANMHRLETEND